MKEKIFKRIKIIEEKRDANYDPKLNYHLSWHEITWYWALLNSELRFLNNLIK